MVLRFCFWGTLVAIFGLGLALCFHQHLPWYATLTCAIGAAGGVLGFIKDIK